MIKTTGNHLIDSATAEIAVALRDASPGQRDQEYYDQAARLRDDIIRGATGGDMESKPMHAAELGRYVCVAHGGCLHSPAITIKRDGVWVRSPNPDPLSGGHLYSSAHRDCFEAWQAREQQGRPWTTPDV